MGEIGPVVVSTDWNYDDDHLIQFCSDRGLLLANINSPHQKRNRAIWCPSSPPRFWTQIDHVILGHRFRGLVNDCQLFLRTSVVSDNSSIRVGFCLSLACGSINARTTRYTPLVPNVHHRLEFRSAVSTQFSLPANDQDLCQRWKQTEDALDAAGLTSDGYLWRHWLCKVLIDRSFWDVTFKEMHKSPKNPLIKNLRRPRGVVESMV